MTNRAVTAMSVHATLKDLGYEECWEHDDGGTTPYRWMGRLTCPKCEAESNPNLLPRSYVAEPQARPVTRRQASEAASRKRGHEASQRGKKRTLSTEQVIEARNRKLGGESYSTIGRHFGVDTQTAWNAVRGVGGYGEVPGALKETQAKPTLSTKEVKDIRRRHAGGETYVSLGLDYNRTKQTIADICRRRTFKNV